MSGDEKKWEGWLKADFHCHSGEDIHDLISHSAEGLIDAAAAQGYDVLSITNHNQVTFSPGLEAYARQRGILLIPGVELTVENKHVLLLNCRDELPPIRKLEELGTLGDGIAVVAPHPYHLHPRSLGPQLPRYRRFFHALEFCHFHYSVFNPNRRVLKDAARWGQPLVGTSDAHYLLQLGTTYTMVQSEKDVGAVIEAVKEGRVKVVTRPLTGREFLRLSARFFFYRPLMKLLRRLVPSSHKV